MKPVTARGIPGNKQGEQMNSKMIAVLAVAIMAVSGCVVTMSVQSDADAVDLGMVYVDTNSAEVELRFNEYAYSQYDSYYMVLKAQVGSYTDTVVFEAEKPTDNKIHTADVPVSESTDLDLTVTKDSMGVYTVKVVNDTDKTAASGEYTISFTLYVNAIIGGTATPLTPIGFNLDVNVRSFTDTQFNIESGEDNKLFAGVSGSVSLTGAITGDDLEKYDWYATGLPEGLNVGVIDFDETKKLAFYGMTATNEDDKDYTVTIIGRDSTGNEVKETDITLTVYKSPKITYKIEGAKLISPGEYMIESGHEVTLTITNSDLGDMRNITVSVIKDDGARDTYLYNNGMEIPTNGVGKYTIEMTVGSEASGSPGDSVTPTNGVTTTVILHVVPNITGAGAGFIVVGQP